jgi:hypothetical protein
VPDNQTPALSVCVGATAGRAGPGGYVIRDANGQAIAHLYSERILSAIPDNIHRRRGAADRHQHRATAGSLHPDPTP